MHEDSGTTTAAPAAEQALNRVDVVGYLSPQRAGKQQVLAREGYHPTTGAYVRLNLQVPEEDGSTYLLPITVPRARIAQDLVFAENMRLRAAGVLRSETAYDSRFASETHTAGQRINVIVVEADRLAPATEEDLDGSFVMLRGSISKPPQLRRHEREGLEVVRTTLEVKSSEPTRRGHGRHVRVDFLWVDIPADLEGAGAGYQVRNEVLIEGRLEALLMDYTRSHQAVAAALERRQEGWQQQLERVQGEARIQAGRQVAREQQRLQQRSGLRVRATYIQLLAGQAIGEEEARAKRDQWIAQRQQRAAQRESQPEAGAAPVLLAPGAPDQLGSELATADLGDGAGSALADGVGRARRSPVARLSAAQ